MEPEAHPIMQGEQLRLLRQHQLLIETAYIHVELLLALFSSPSFLKQYYRPTIPTFRLLLLSYLPVTASRSSVGVQRKTC
jgi:hypothetical protein